MIGNMATRRINRRIFIKKSTAGTLGLGLSGIKYFPLPDQDEKSPRIKDYRRLGRTNAMVSDIGSGIPYSESVLKAAIDSGVNFIETAESYDNGKNEILIGNAIRSTEREKLFLATKINLLSGILTSSDDIEARARESLKRLNTPYIDLYMMHQAQSVVKVTDKNFHKACDKLKREGKIKFRGLSCHGTFWWQEAGGSLEEILMAAIDDGRYDVLFFPYNFLDPGMGERVLQACRSKNIGTMIMKSNPVGVYESYENTLKRGDQLSSLEEKDYERKRLQMEKAREFFGKYRMTDMEELKRGAYQFILANKNVSTICCRFRNFSDIEWYARLSGTTLSKPIAELLSDFREKLGFLNCRIGCNLCEKSCPEHIPVNTILRYNYYAVALNEKEAARHYYMELGKSKADRCSSCKGLCEKACPHYVAIRDILYDANRNLS
jgi:predicted aldo/keto reductase-like oxidoreductase